MHMNFWGPLLRAATLGQLGRTEKAALAYQELVALQPDFAAQPNHYVSCYIHAEQTRAEVFEGLRVAGLPKW